MERRRTTLIVIAMLLSSHISSHAYMKFVIDKSCIAAETGNTALIKKLEDDHNKQLDSIKSRKKKIASYTASMATIKELYKLSMQNVRGFGTESVYYREMAEEFGKMPLNTARALKAISHSPVVNYINGLNYISNIQLHAISLIGTFVDIVSNGSVRLSDFTSHKKGDKLSELLKKAHIRKGDGYNFLDRNERLTLANSLLFDLRNLNYNLEQLVYVSQYCGLREMLYNLDPMTWYNYVNAKYDVEYAIMQWNNDPLI